MFEIHGDTFNEEWLQDIHRLESEPDSDMIHGDS